MSKRQSLKEKALLLKLRISKDPEVYGELYDLYIPKIYRFVLFKTRTKEEAEDIAAEAFLKAWKYIQEDRRVENFNALLYQIARNLVIDHYRKKSRSEITTDEQVFTNIPDGRPTIDEKVAIDSEMQQVLTAMQQLKDDYREIIALRYIEEMDVKEIAKIIDKSEGAVRVLCHRAIKALRSIMTEEDIKRRPNFSRQ